MNIKSEFCELRIIFDNLDKDKEKIIEKWIQKESKSSFSQKRFDKKQKTILKIFGLRILEHQFDIISENKLGIFDTVVVVMDYFLKKKFSIIDMYRYYSDLKNVTLFYYINKYPEKKDKIYYKIASLFDRNFILFMNEFLLDIYNDCNNKEDKNSKKEGKENKKNIELCNDKDNKKIENKKEIRKKDIRFTKKDTISATEFVEELDYTIFDKVDSILEQIDDLIVLLYSLEDSNDSKKSLELVQSIEGHFDKIPKLLVSLGVFEIIERTFKNLIEFLSTITEEMLQDKDKKVLLVNLLLALTQDFENWLKVLFIDKSANDIHYFDASFSANILKIEKIFSEENENSNGEEDCEIDFF